MTVETPQGRLDESAASRAERSCMTSADAEFVRRLLLASLVVAVLAIAWLLLDLLLIIFASALLAIVLRAMAVPISRVLRIEERWGVAAAVLIIVGVLAGVILLFGSQVADQLAALLERLPQEITRLRALLHIERFNEVLGSGSVSTVGNLMSRALSWGSTLAGNVAFLVVFVFGGLYFALDPMLYRSGVLELVPQNWQPEVEATLDDCESSLRQWLGAQLLGMLAVGVLTTIGLLLAGVPSPLALGLIAGLAEFVPYAGPVIAAVPGLVIAASQDWQTLGWATVVYLVVQQLESNFLMPVLASRNVSLPPGLAIFSVIGMGIVFGLPGLLLGFPLTVVLMVAVQRLYVVDVLGRSVEIAGEQTRPLQPVSDDESGTADSQQIRRDGVGRQSAPKVLHPE